MASDLHCRGQKCASCQRATLLDDKKKGSACNSWSCILCWSAGQAEDGMSTPTDETSASISANTSKDRGWRERHKALTQS